MTPREDLRHDWWADGCACSMCTPDVELPGMWERSDFVETEHECERERGRHSMFDLCDGFTPDGEPCPVCAPAEPHICERGQLKFNGGSPVYLCRVCRVIMCYEDGTPYV